VPKQSQLAEGIASLRFTPLAMTKPDYWFLEWTHPLKEKEKMASYEHLPIYKKRLIWRVEQSKIYSFCTKIFY